MARGRHGLSHGSMGNYFYCITVISLTAEPFRRLPRKNPALYPDNIRPFLLAQTV